jgi:hypothetical protein
MPAASMALQKSATAFSVEADTLPPFATTADRHAAASGWTPEAMGRSNLGDIAIE